MITTVNNGNHEVGMNIEAGTMTQGADHTGKAPEYVGALTGRRVTVNGGRIQVNVPANSGEIWIPEELMSESLTPLKTEEIVAPMKIEPPVNEAIPTQEEPSVNEETPAQEETLVREEIPAQEETLVREETPTQNEPSVGEAAPEEVVIDWSKSYEEMTVAELQEAILEKMRGNGPVTDYMLKTVRENTHHGSLVNWVKSFR